MLMQYMTTGDSSSWNALFSYRDVAGGGEGARGNGGGVSGGERQEGMGRRNTREMKKNVVRMKGLRGEEMENLINSLW